MKYVIDPHKLEKFEEYARRWLSIVKRMGGLHHGCFLPGEGANNVAISVFSFPSLAAYEEYRHRMAQDAECQSVFELEKINRSILSYERNFMRPLLEPHQDQGEREDGAVLPHPEADPRTDEVLVVEAQGES